MFRCVLLHLQLWAIYLWYLDLSYLTDEDCAFLHFISSRHRLQTWRTADHHAYINVRAFNKAIEGMGDRYRRGVTGYLPENDRHSGRSLPNKQTRNCDELGRPSTRYVPRKRSTQNFVAFAASVKIAQSEEASSREALSHIYYEESVSASGTVRHACLTPIRRMRLPLLCFKTMHLAKTCPN
jgi:hypothetical protein